MVLTLVVVVDEATHYDALHVGADAGPRAPVPDPRRDPRPGRARPGSTPRSGSAEAQTGRHDRAAPARRARQARRLGRAAAAAAGHPGRRRGGRARRRQCPGEDPIGALAQRRITDAAASRAADARAAPAGRVATTPGDTDLAWTRLTPWRALLAAALDQLPGARSRGDGRGASAATRAPRCWPAGSRRASASTVERRESKGPGHHAVRSSTARPRTATRSGSPGRTACSPSSTCPAARTARSPCAVARPLELLAEELRRLDPDEVYATVIKGCALAERDRRDQPDRRRARRRRDRRRRPSRPGSSPASSTPRPPAGRPRSCSPAARS